MQLHVFVLSGEILSHVLRVVGEARQRTLGPFSPSFNIHDLLLEGLEKVMGLHESRPELIPLCVLVKTLNH